MSNPMPISILEQRAAAQRRQLHNSVSELRSSVQQKIDVKHQLRQHFAPAAGVVGVLGLALGWAATGAFVRD